MSGTASTPVVDLLETWGPGQRTPVSLPDAQSYCRGLALAHGENFSVLSRFVPGRMLEGMCAVYAFCRWAERRAGNPPPVGAYHPAVDAAVAELFDACDACVDALCEEEFSA